MVRTLSVYIGLEKRWRGPGRPAERIIRAEWARKTAAEKRLIVALINEALETASAAAAQAKVWASAKARFDAEPTTDNNTYPFRNAADSAQEAAEALRNAHEKDSAAWNRVRTTLIDQRAVAESVRQTKDFSDQARTKAAAAAGESQNLRDRLDGIPLPEHPPGTGIRKVKEAWLSQRAVRTIRKAKADAELVREGIGLSGAVPEEWSAVKQFNGGMSTASLYVQFDENECIRDRAVRKEELFSENTWYDGRRWEGNVQDLATRVPWELACTRAINTVPDLQNVVRLRQNTPKIDTVLRKQVLYFEYAPHGDLSGLVETYQRKKEKIPEAMIWHIAESLVGCLVAMEHGTVSKDEKDDAAGWLQIVHRDMKPPNVFLASPDPERYPFYPKPVLGDFGLAIRTHSEDAKNPEWWTGAGTDGFRAPEMVNYVDRDTLKPIDRFPILSHTDMYGLGLILYCLVKLEMPFQQIWTGDPASNPLNRISQAAKDKLGYSRQVYELIEGCLKFKPTDRFTSRDLLDWIQRLMTREEGSSRFHQGMIDHSATPDDINNYALHFPDDLYLIGMARDQIP